MTYVHCRPFAGMQMAESVAEYDFVEQPSQDHFCVVTLELLRDPHQTTCCGHHLSQEAASRLQRDGKPCPMCQRPNLSTHADLYFRRKVNEINVRCPQKSQGCKWVGEVGNLDSHLGNQCLWVRVSCPKSCGGSVLRGNLPLHLDADCPKRNYRCKYCQFQATYEVVQKHLPRCPKQPVRCPNHCEIRTVERSNLEQHLSECPLQLVECEFSQAGCKEKVPRRDLVSHVRENAQQHLLSMSLLNLTLTRELREKMEEKDRQIAELREELKRQGKEIEQRDRQTHQQLQEGKQQVTLLQQEVKEQSQQQLKKLEQLQHQGQEEMKQLSYLQDRINIGTGSSSHDSVLTEFSTKKAGNVEWYSKALYSRGYKFRLNIDSNGHSDAEGTHVTAFLQLLEGESDDNLLWPIVCDGQLQLLNQQGGHDHHVATFHRELGKGDRGYSSYITISLEFIAHSDLAPKYLKHDCLHFRLYINVTPK